MSGVYPFFVEEKGTEFIKQNNNFRADLRDKSHHSGTNITKRKPNQHKDETIPNIKDEISEFANNVSILGMKQVANPKFSPVRRLIWLAFVLCGSGFLIFHLWNRISYFLENPASVDIKFHHNDSIHFPTVTICNNNMFKLPYLKANGHLEQANYFDIVFNHPNFTNIEQYNWTDFHTRNQYKMADLMPALCYFKNVMCTDGDFSMIETEMGSCIQFNAEGELKSVETEGSVFGLKLYLFAQQSDYASFTTISGFTVLMHERGEFPDMLGLGLQVSPGESVHIAMKQRRLSNLPPPHGQCKERTLKYFPKYTKLNCDAECYLNHTQTCGCRMFYQPKTGNQTIDDQRTCNLKDIMFECFNISTEQMAGYNGCDCMEACQSTLYTHSISHTRMSEVFINRLIAMYNNTDTSFFRENIIMLNIFYSDISVEEVVQQEAYSALTLFADIGGALGLVLGSTLMTAAEIVDFVLGVSLRKLFGKRV